MSPKKELCALSIVVWRPLVWCFQKKHIVFGKLLSPLQAIKLLCGSFSNLLGNWYYWLLLYVPWSQNNSVCKLKRNSKDFLMWILQTETLFIYLNFLFVLILDSVSSLVAHLMMGFFGILKPEKIIEMNSGEFFFLLCWK